MQRRHEMKQQLGLPEDYGVQDSDDDQGGSCVVWAGKRSARSLCTAMDELQRHDRSGLSTVVMLDSGFCPAVLISTPEVMCSRVEEACVRCARILMCLS